MNDKLEEDPAPVPRPTKFVIDSAICALRGAFGNASAEWGMVHDVCNEVFALRVELGEANAAAESRLRALQSQADTISRLNAELADKHRDERPDVVAFQAGLLEKIAAVLEEKPPGPNHHRCPSCGVSCGRGRFQAHPFCSLACEKASKTKAFDAFIEDRALRAADGPSTTLAEERDLFARQRDSAQAVNTLLSKELGDARLERDTTVLRLTNDLGVMTAKHARAVRVLSYLDATEGGRKALSELDAKIETLNADRAQLQSRLEKETEKAREAALELGTILVRERNLLTLLKRVPRELSMILTFGDRADVVGDIVHVIEALSPTSSQKSPCKLCGEPCLLPGDPDAELWMFDVDGPVHAKCLANPPCDKDCDTRLTHGLHARDCAARKRGT